jgi:hypothetical protein
MRLAAYTIVGAVGLGLMPSIAAGEVQFGAVQTHKGMCEASAAIAVPEGRVDGLVIIANDQDNTLRAYRAQGAEPLLMPSGKLNNFLDLDPDDDEDDKADFEGATWLNGKAYWIASHSRSGKGRLRESRRQFFATHVSIQSDLPVVTPTSQKSFGGLLAAISALDLRLDKTIKLGVEKDKKLAPDNGGFNIEGLTARADGKSMLLGLRSPLLDGDALLIPFENPEAVLEKDEQPILRSPIRLGLNGKGIRSIEYSTAAKAYFIVAGPSGGKSGTFDLFRWPGDEKSSATPIPGFAAALQKLDTSRPFQPEALVVDSTGKKLRLFSDDGDTCDKAAPTFRSVELTIP